MPDINVVSLDSNAEHFRQAGLRHLKDGNYTDAVGCLRHSIRLTGAESGCWGDLARVYDAMQCPAEGRKMAILQVLYRPEDRDAWVTLGRCAGRLGNYSESRRAYHFSLILNPDESPRPDVLEGLHELDTAMDYKAMLSRKEIAAEKAVEYAEKYLRKEEHEHAKRSLERGARLDPANFDIRIRLAHCELMLGDPEPAERLLETLKRETTPIFDPVQVLGHAADICLLLGRTNDAKELLVSLPQEVLSHYPEQAVTEHIERLVRAGENVLAHEFVMTERKRFPYSLTLMHLSAVIDLKLGDVESAQKSWKRALRIFPDMISVKTLLKGLTAGTITAENVPLCPDRCKAADPGDEMNEIRSALNGEDIYRLCEAAKQLAPVDDESVEHMLLECLTSLPEDSYGRTAVLAALTVGHLERVPRLEPFAGLPKMYAGFDEAIGRFPGSQRQMLRAVADTAEDVFDADIRTEAVLLWEQITENAGTAWLHDWRCGAAALAYILVDYHKHGDADPAEIANAFQCSGRKMLHYYAKMRGALLRGKLL